MSPRIVIFGVSGAIGSALAAHFSGLGHAVTGVSRTKPRDVAGEWVCWDSGADGAALANQLTGHPISAVIWAQGMNGSDNPYSFDRSHHLAMYEANVISIMDSLQALLNERLIGRGARLCIVSSIWQNIARQNKLSYCVTKSALLGLVNAMAVDLGRDGILVNAVLPGPLDTPMTRANLTSAQLAGFEQGAPLGSLPTLADVCHLAAFLCSPDNTGITGQFVTADRGYSHARYV